MLSKQKLVGAVLGLAMMALPATALAHPGHGWGRGHQGPAWTCNRGREWQPRGAWWRHDNDDWRHDDDDAWRHHHDDDDWGRPAFGSPGFARQFQDPGHGAYYGGYNGAYNNSSSLAYLMQRRSAAWKDYRAARARGDKRAERRLGNVIRGLSSQIRRDNGGHNLKGNYAYASGPAYSYSQSYLPPYYGPGYGSQLGAVVGQLLGW